ncbi:MAG TPA: formylglycine-generating enzyme family protein [Myxococcota bacterium]|nr:formylglycine-generating enzyme family protein [Myxococcota bacterium]
MSFKTSFIAPGNFTMGSPTTETDRFSDEGPVEVRLSHGFELMQTEVTQSLWYAIEKTSPSSHQACGDCPVEKVSWYDAVRFANDLSRSMELGEAYRKVGETTWELVPGSTGWRLPTEAEWEYAARGGQRTLYSGGDEVGSVAWYNGNSGGSTHAVGTLRPNGWGLYDMSGNVWEWVWDVYGSSLKGGLDPVAGGAGARVYRGGCWGFTAALARVAYRNWWAPGRADDRLGFRLSRTVP